MVDLYGLDFMDSSGLYAIARIHGEMKSNGKNLNTNCCGTGLKKLLEITRLKRALSTEEATNEETRSK